MKLYIEINIQGKCDPKANKSGENYNSFEVEAGESGKHMNYCTLIIKQVQIPCMG